MNKDRKERSLIVANLFPVSRQAVERVTTLKSIKAIEAMINRFRKGNPELFKSLVYLQNFYEVLEPDENLDPGYKFGFTMAYGILEQEAVLRGGSIPLLQMEVIDKTLDDITNIGIVKLPNETTTHAINRVAAIVTQAEQEDSEDTENNILSIEGFLDDYYKNRNTRYMERWENLTGIEPYFTAAAHLVYRELPEWLSRHTVAFHMMGYIDTYSAFLTNYDIHTLRQLSNR